MFGDTVAVTVVSLLMAALLTGMEVSIAVLVDRKLGNVAIEMDELSVLGGCVDD